MNRTRSEAGSAALELALITPVLLLFLLLAVALGRLATARADVDGAAGAAARAASIARSPVAARSSAEDVAAATLGDRSVPCADLDVTVDTAYFRPGGQVVVDLTCTVRLGQLARIGLPGTKTMHARGVAVIDVFRGSA